MKEQFAFLGQLALLYPIALVVGALLVPQAGSQPKVIGLGPVIVALVFGLLVGAGLSTISRTIRDTAPLVGMAPVGFVLMSLVGRGSIRQEFYVIASAKEGGASIALVTLPVLFYAGYSLGAFAFTRFSEKSAKLS